MLREIEALRPQTGGDESIDRREVFSIRQLRRRGHLERAICPVRLPLRSSIDPSLKNSDVVLVERPGLGRGHPIEIVLRVTGGVRQVRSSRSTAPGPRRCRAGSSESSLSFGASPSSGHGTRNGARPGSAGRRPTNSARLETAVGAAAARHSLNLTVCLPAALAELGPTGAESTPLLQREVVPGHRVHLRLDKSGSSMPELVRCRPHAARGRSIPGRRAADRCRLSAGRRRARHPGDVGRPCVMARARVDVQCSMVLPRHWSEITRGSAQPEQGLIPGFAAHETQAPPAPRARRADAKPAVAVVEAVGRAPGDGQHRLASSRRSADELWKLAEERASRRPRGPAWIPQGLHQVDGS